MAGYSGTPLARKLGVKPGYRVAIVNAPDGFERVLRAGEFPDDAQLRPAATRSRPVDVIVAFVTSSKELARRFQALAAAFHPSGGLWFAWPKRTSGVPTDLTEDVIRDLALAAGLVDNKVCAIDDIWSGLRLVVRVRDRQTPTPSARPKPRARRS